MRKEKKALRLNQTVNKKQNIGESAALALAKGELSSIKGTPLDDAQYIALLMKGEADRGKGRAVIGSVEVRGGRKYHVSIVGQPAITDHKGQSVTSHSALASMIRENRTDELNFDALAYLEMSGRLPDGRDYYGAYYSMADLEKHAAECAEKGEL